MMLVQLRRNTTLETCTSSKTRYLSQKFGRCSLLGWRSAKLFFVGKCYLKKKLDHNLSLVRKNSQQISLCLGVEIKAMNCNVCNSSPWKDLRLFGERFTGGLALMNYQR